MAEEIVIFDIDGTLANVSERIHHVKKKPGNWNAFFAGMAQDKAIHSMLPEFEARSVLAGARNTMTRQ